MRGTNK